MNISQDPETSSGLLYTIATILFALSMISERLANMYKLWRPEMRTKTENKNLEKIRERNVMWTALGSGWIVAVISGADFFSLIRGNGLLNIFEDGFESTQAGCIQTAFGMFLSGIFISLGSKFWHDMLDIILQISNLKKYQANTAASVAQESDVDALKARIQLVEPKLKEMEGYSGYDFALGASVINLKFNKDKPPNDQQTVLIQNTLGKNNVQIVKSNIKI